MRVNVYLSIGLAFVLVLWALLWMVHFEPGGDFDIALILLTVSLQAGIVLHMFRDRGLRLWTMASVAVLIGALTWAAYFSRTGWVLKIGRLEPGVNEGWLDAVRAGVLANGVLFWGALIWFHRRKVKQGKRSRPGELLMVEEEVV